MTLLAETALMVVKLPVREKSVKVLRSVLVWVRAVQLWVTLVALPYSSIKIGEKGLNDQGFLRFLMVSVTALLTVLLEAKMVPVVAYTSVVAPTTVLLHVGEKSMFYLRGKLRCCQCRRWFLLDL